MHGPCSTSGCTVADDSCLPTRLAIQWLDDMHASLSHGQDATELSLGHACVEGDCAVPPGSKRP